MTIAAVWVRTLETGAEELVFCSDSRLSNGKRFDHCQKIFRFTRTDAAIGFAGDTDWAYPMIVAAVTAADLHLPSQTRALTLSKFKVHLINILNQMQREVHSYAKDQEIPGAIFLFGGYDWWYKKFRIWRIEFSMKEKKFLAHERTGSNAFGSLGRIDFSGDDEWVREFRKKLKQKAQGKYGLAMNAPKGCKFNMEPFEVIRDLIRSANERHSIGGSPQAVKIYQFMNSADVGVFWPNIAEGRLHVSGRPLLDYERATLKSVLDPDSLNSTWCNGNSKTAKDQISIAIKNDQLVGDELDVPEGEANPV